MWPFTQQRLQKRAELQRAHRMETFRIDCHEIVSWIQDKTRILEDSGGEYWLFISLEVYQY